MVTSSGIRRVARAFPGPALDAATAVAVPTLAGAHPAGIFVFTALLLTLNAASGLYRQRMTLSITADLPAATRNYLAATGLTLLAVLFTGEHGDPVPLQLWCATFVALVITRFVLYTVTRMARARGYAHQRTLIIGAGPIAQDLTRTLTRTPSYGVTPVGYLNPEPDPVMPIPYLGQIDSATLPATINDNTIDLVVVSVENVDNLTLITAVRSLNRRDVAVLYIPYVWQITARASAEDTVGDVPLIRVPRQAWRSPTWFAKQMFDRAGAAVALVLLFPILATIALAVRVVDGKHIIFSQTRIGVDGTPFHVYKFRTLKTSRTESDTTWNIAGDTRMSNLGKILRKTSLDELPQLVNILKGDMSFVGPRPERPSFAEEFTATYPDYVWRARVPCGLTGWAQIHGLRGDTSIAMRARYDNYYVENWSLWLDFTILIRTIPAMLNGS